MTGWATLALAACAVELHRLVRYTRTEEGKVVGPRLRRAHGRGSRSLGRFLQELGFRQDPAANPAWRRDEVLEKLYGIGSVETRMAKMYVDQLEHAAAFRRLSTRAARPAPSQPLQSHGLGPRGEPLRADRPRCPADVVATEGRQPAARALVGR